MASASVLGTRYQVAGDATKGKQTLADHDLRYRHAVLCSTGMADIAKNYAFYMTQSAAYCLVCNKIQLHSNAPGMLPCPTSRNTGEPQYPTLITRP